MPQCSSNLAVGQTTSEAGDVEVAEVGMVVYGTSEIARRSRRQSCLVASYRR